MYFRIFSIAEDGSSGIGAKLGIKKDALLNNTETVDIWEARVWNVLEVRVSCSEDRRQHRLLTYL